MDEPSKSFAPELSPSASRRWIGRLIVAVVIGVAIWNFVVALTSHVVVPALARVLPADPQSPFYLGTGDYNVAAFFASVLELCFAGIAAALVSAGTNRNSKPARRKPQSVAPSMGLSLSPPAAGPQQTPHRRIAPPTDPVPAQAASPSAQSQPPAAAAAPAQAAKPVQAVRPKAPKKVYYNLVGEPIESDEDQ